MWPRAYVHREGQQNCVSSYFTCSKRWFTRKPPTPPNLRSRVPLFREPSGAARPCATGRPDCLQAGPLTALRPGGCVALGFTWARLCDTRDGYAMPATVYRTVTDAPPNVKRTHSYAQEMHTTHRVHFLLSAPPPPGGGGGVVPDRDAGSYMNPDTPAKKRENGRKQTPPKTKMDAPNDHNARARTGTHIITDANIPYRPASPLCGMPSGCCFCTAPRTVTRSSLGMLRWVAAFCRPLQPVPDPPPPSVENRGALKVVQVCRCAGGSICWHIVRVPWGCHDLGAHRRPLRTRWLVRPCAGALAQSHVATNRARMGHRVSGKHY